MNSFMVPDANISSIFLVGLPVVIDQNKSLNIEHFSIDKLLEWNILFSSPAFMILLHKLHLVAQVLQIFSVESKKSHPASGLVVQRPCNVNGARHVFHSKGSSKVSSCDFITNP